METKQTNKAVLGCSGSDGKEQLGVHSFGAPLKLMSESRDGPRMLEGEALARNIQTFKNENLVFWWSWLHPGWLSFMIAQLDIPTSCPQLSQKMPKTKMVNKHLRNKPHAKKLHSNFWALTKTSLNNSWRDHLEIRIEKLGLLVGPFWMNIVHHFHT